MEINRDLISLYTIAQLLAGDRSPESIPDEAWKPLLQLAEQHEAMPLLVGKFAPFFFQQPSPQLAKQWSVLSLKWQVGFRPIEAAASHLHHALAAKGAKVIWLKGICLAYRYYSLPWMRQMVDLDIWVAKDTVDDVLETLLQRGYQLNEQFGGNQLKSDQFANHYTLVSPNNISIELHFDLIQPRVQMLSSSETAWFWEHTQVIDTPVGALCMLQPEANLLHLAYHDIIMHDMLDVTTFDEIAVSLKRKYDVYLLLTQSEINWELVIDQARQLGWVFALQTALEHTETYFGWQIPAHVKERVFEEGGDTPAAMAFDTSEKRLVGKWQTFLQLPWTLKIRYLRVMFFPTAHKLQWAYPTAKEQSYPRLLWHHYKTAFQTVRKWRGNRP